TAPGPGQAGSGKPVPPGSRALLVSGIARPRSFRDTVERLGFPVADHLVFPDHHEYPDASLAKIARRFHQSGATVVMATGKDRVKLQGRLELPLAEVPIRAAPAPELFVWLDERLAEIAAGGSSR
ncbi:MAG TPA: tetraacyldisaccharide 4'-kinase, partial [Thermoanaerobaculia bacterium]